MLTLFRRVIFILLGGIVVIGSSLLLPNILNNDGLLSQSIVMNSKAIVNTSSQNVTPPIYIDAASIGYIGVRTDDCLLILRQNRMNQRNMFYIEKNNLSVYLYCV